MFFVIHRPFSWPVLFCLIAGDFLLLTWTFHANEFFLWKFLLCVFRGSNKSKMRIVEILVYFLYEFKSIFFFLFEQLLVISLILINAREQHIFATRLTERGNQTKFFAVDRHSNNNTLVKIIILINIATIIIDLITWLPLSLCVFIQLFSIQLM